MVFLGLDVGGTRCRYEWWPAGSHPGGDAAPVPPVAHGRDATVDGLAAALATAQRTTLPTAAVCAVAGVGDTTTRDGVVAGLAARAFGFPIAVVADVLAAAAAGLAHAPGVLLWSGTGSFALARAADGELVRVGGRGYLLGDQGSGYDFVRRAAAAALLAADGLGPATALAGELTGAFAAPSVERLGAVLQHLPPRDVAARLPVVLATAAAGDAVAQTILGDGVTALVAMALAAARRAGLAWPDLPVGLGGGVLHAAPAITTLLADRLRALGAAAPVPVAPRAAAAGAAWLAQGWYAGQEPQRSWVQRGAV